MLKVGRYTIQGKLGRGGMSSVYKAQAPITGRTVALKILLPRDEIYVDLVGEERLREIFTEEARIMGEISHDHVAKIIDCDEHDGAPFIVMEYFAHSLGTIIGESYRVEEPSRVIRISKTYQYINQSLKGLERLHFAGIIHRDIKPFNLMITNDDRVKIIDFGLSRVRGEEKMAIPGMQVGSPYYASPEQEKEPKKADERSDLFSVGIMAYRMLTGQLPIIKNVKIPSSLNADLNRDWDEFLLASIAIKPENRFTSAHKMRLQLKELYTKWSRQSRKSCKFIAYDQAEPSLQTERLRSEATFIRYKSLQGMFDLDSLMRPRIYTTHRVEYINSRLIKFLDTRLMWQRQGAGFTLPWLKAQEYIDYLNARQWQGYSNWRLPTVDELNSVLRTPSLLHDFCFESYFAENIHWLWSCDTCTKKKAWLTDIQESYFQALDKDGVASVCAVRSTSL